MKKKLLSLMLCVSIFFAGCVGREANPIAVYLPGDENRSCKGLMTEIAQLQVDMAKLQSEKGDKETSNVLLALCGILFFPVWFFMDFKDAEKIEYDAMRQRHNRLLVYAAEKNCDMMGIKTEKILSVDEIKEQEDEK